MVDAQAREAMKDVGSCDNLRLAQLAIDPQVSGMGTTAAERRHHAVSVRRTGELKHLSTRRKRKNRFPQ